MKGSGFDIRRFRTCLLFSAATALGLMVWPSTAHAMHISEGVLPAGWAGLYFAIALPFVIFGFIKLARRKAEIPGYMPLVGIVGAAVFIFSCLPIPVIALHGAATAHPAGTGLSAILLGPTVSVAVSSVALLIQALFLGHGGLTTLGANVCSMGIMGSFGGYGVFRLARRLRFSLLTAGIAAGIAADLLTYLGTSFFLGALTISGGWGQVVRATAEIFGIFMITSQGPLCILEGVVTGLMINHVYKRRPEVLVKMGVA